MEAVIKIKVLLKVDALNKEELEKYLDNIKCDFYSTIETINIEEPFIFDKEIIKC